jgi:lipoic acid synthetase
MKLRHVVITSVDRDELPDCGSTHFAACITETKRLNPETTVEVLIPDFKAKPESLQRIFDAAPHIINHNIETGPSLYREICPQSSYTHSLKVLQLSAEAGFMTKTGLILGLGETIDEVKQVIMDARKAGVKLLTIGQYLQPTPDHAPLRAYIAPEIFEQLKSFALQQGFIYVEAGPLVRSSYHAGDVLDFLLQAGGKPVDRKATEGENS